jgi:SMODS and SLOG-associating 2TM effector domain family 5
VSDTPLDSNICSSKVLNELLRRAKITSAARYNRARILKLHAAWSQWTLSILATGQIVITVIPLFFHDISKIAKQTIDYGGVFFGVLVLAYSLLLGMSNFSARADKMHSCGIDMGKLSKKLHLWSCGNNSTNEQYLEAVNEYYGILSKHENHEKIDFWDELTDEEYTEKYKKKKSSFFCFVRRYISFSHYFISLVLMAVWFIALL